MAPLDLLYQALHSPHGLAVWCSAPEQGRKLLYAVRSKHGDPLLESLGIFHHPPEEIWIIKQKLPPNPGARTAALSKDPP